MSRRLFIYLPVEEEAPVTWLVTDSSDLESTVEVQEGLEEASLQAAGARTIVIIPGSTVLLGHARIPSRNRQRILSALPFMLEDQLISDIDQLHFAIGDRDVNGVVNTAVIDRTVMNTWLARLRSFDIEPDVLVPDILCVVLTPGHWTLFQDQDHSLLRTGVQSGAAIDNENLATITGIFLEEAGEHSPDEIDCICRENQPVPLADLDDTVKLSIQALDVDALSFLARGYDEKTVINLLQGEYSRHEQLGKLWRPWIPALALLAILIIINGGITIVDSFQLSKSQALLTKNIEKIYLDTFPDARRVVNPKVQMQRRLTALRSGGGAFGSDFLDILKSSGQVINSTAGLELQRFSYREGRLDIALTINDLQALDQLKQRLADNAKLNVEIQSANARNGKVEARMQLGTPSR